MEPVATKGPDTSREPDPVTQNRRRQVRHKVHTPAYATLDGASGGMVLDLNEILDISQDGMAIQTSPPLEVNRIVSLCLDLSETKTYIHTNGNVIWADISGRTGIRFADMPEASVSHLKQWLFQNAMAGVARGSAQPSRPEIQSKGAASTSATVEVGTLPAENDSKFAAPPDYTSTLAALAAVGREVEALGSDLDAALQLVAERTLAFMHATGAAIALWLEDEMVCVAAAGPEAPGRGARFQINAGFSGECIRTGKLLRCDDTDIDPCVDREACRVLGIRSIVAIPIRMENTILGLLEVFASEPSAFSEKENRILQGLSDIALAAIKRAGEPPTAKASPEVSGQLFRQFSSKTVAEIVAPKRFSLRKTLPIVAAASLALVLLWTVTSWVRSWIGGSGQTSSQKQANRYQSLPRTAVTSIADASDLGALRKLAEEGDPAAQFALGARYATGQEVSQSYTEAVRWFSKAGEHGHVVAQATLGAYYWAGRGVPQDLSKAYFWSILAQAGGDEASKYRVAVLASRMSRGQVVAAQEQANDWIKRHQLTSSVPSSSQ
jgi:putative methionine-R-sulfoxide reductase with GAF domain